MAIDWLMNLIIEKIANNFYGTIKINICNGVIVNAIIEESVKPPSKEPCGPYGS